MDNIKIYSTPTCAFCRMTKKFFVDNNIEYTDIDVSSNQEKAQEMIEKSGQMGVPVIIIEKEGKEEMILGFDEKKLKEILEIKK